MKKIVLLWATFFLVFPSLGQAQVSFSHPHGIYDEPIHVELSSKYSEATIHYTLDGSEPTAISPVYKEPFVIDATTIIRAVEVRDGMPTSEVNTASYLFPASILSQSNTPEGYPSTWGPFCQINGTAPAYYEMYRGFDNYDELVPMMKQGLRDLPSLSIVTDRNHLFSHERDSVRGGIYIYTGCPVGNNIGRGWERPASIELMGGPQQHDLTCLCGIVIHGGHGRLPEKNPKHSFRLKFKKEYGGKKTLEYPVFGDTVNAQYDQLVLRCHFGNSWQHWDNRFRLRAQYSRDMWARYMQKSMGHAAVAGLYVNLFINGMYWGLYNIAERIDDQFCKNHDGGKKSNYDVIKVEEIGGHQAEASEGSIDAWKEMITVANMANQTTSYLRLQGLNAEGEQSEELEPLLDMDNFIDYMLINQYCGNNDWSTHNWYAYRLRGEGSTGFKFLCWDSEQIFEGVNDNLLDLNYAGNPSGIFQSLIKHPDFLHRYMDRANEILQPEGLLGEDHVMNLWDSLFHTIEHAVYLESSRWGNYRREVHPYQSRGSRFRMDPYYLNERNRLLTEYFPQRINILRNELTKRKWLSKTEAPKFLLNGEEQITRDTISASDILTLTGPTYMVCTTDGHRPVTWIEQSKGAPTPTSFNYEKDNLLLHLATSDEGTWVTFRAIGMRSSEWGPSVSRRFFIASTPAGIKTADYLATTPSHSQAIYDLTGRHVADDKAQISHIKKGIYIINNKKVVKK